MKKSLAAVLAAILVLGVGSAALAAPVEISGDFRFQGRSIDDKINGAAQYDHSWFQLRSRINLSTKVDDKTTFFGRFSSRNNFGTGSVSSAEFDQYGIKTKASDFDISLGRQAVNLGQGTIISTGSDAAGVDNKFDGVIATTKSGDFDLTFIGGKTTNATATAAEWYGLDFATKMNDNIKVGGAWATGRPDSAKSVKYWGINTEIKMGKSLALNTEYVKSDANNNNKAYFIAGTYSWAKESFTIQYNDVQNNAVDQFNSGIGSVAYPFAGVGLDTGNTKYKGFTYVYGREINKTLSFHAIYLDLEVDGKTGSDQEFAAGLVWKF